ncbi:MAG: FHA domain-containing protein, partial [Gemmataceae bacterium]
CQLRPASQAVSKQHCAIVVRGTQVFLKDFGSTNGTFLNDTQLEPNTEVELAVGARVRVGPLDLTVQFNPSAKPSDSTPLPEVLKSVNPGSGTLSSPAAAGLKAAVGSGAKPPSSAGTKPVPVTTAGSKPVIPPVPAPKPIPIPVPKPVAMDDDGDAAAAMLLGMGDDDDSSSGMPRVPEGSTIFEMPAIGAAKGAEAEKKGGSTPSREDTSSAASEILRKYMRRTK